MNKKVFKKKKTGISNNSISNASSRFSMSKKTNMTNPNEIKAEIDAIDEQNLDVLGSLVQEPQEDRNNQVSPQLHKKEENIEQDDNKKNSESCEFENMGFFNANRVDHISISKLKDVANVEDVPIQQLQESNDDTTNRNAVITNTGSLNLNDKNDKPFESQKISMPRTKELDPKNWKSLGVGVANEFNRNKANIFNQDNSDNKITELNNEQEKLSKIEEVPNVDNDATTINPRKDLIDAPENQTLIVENEEINKSGNKNVSKDSQINNKTDKTKISSIEEQQNIKEENKDKSSCKQIGNENCINNNNEDDETKEVGVDNEGHSVLNNNEQSKSKKNEDYNDIENSNVNENQKFKLSQSISKTSLYENTDTANFVNDNQINLKKSNGEVLRSEVANNYISEFRAMDINYDKKQNNEQSTEFYNEQATKAQGKKQVKKRGSWLTKIMDETNNRSPLKKSTLLDSELQNTDDTDKLKLQIAKLKTEKEAEKTRNNKLLGEQNLYKKEIESLKRELEITKIHNVVDEPVSFRMTDENDVETKMRIIEPMRYANSEALIRIKSKLDKFRDFLDRIPVDNI